MSRPPRIEIDNGVYHVTARGNERQLIFRDDHDHERFLEILARVARRFRWRVLCYCLMGNHYHVLVLTLEANLARGMRQLNGVYAQWFNRRHERVGHLFQGRYKAVLVQHDGHLANSLRYIVRNPTRSGIVQHVDEWRWASHAEIIGTTKRAITSIPHLLSYLGADKKSARARYLELIHDPTEPRSSSHPLLDGDDDFVDEHLALLRPSPEHPSAGVRATQPDIADLVRDRNDHAGIHCASVEHGFSLRQIATHVGCSTATIHRRLVRQLDDDMS